MCRSRKIPDLAKAMAMLSEHGYSCVFCSGQKQYTSHGRGVMPLIHFLSSEIFFMGACAADQVVGKAAALLMVLAGVKSVYAPVMSESGLYVLSYYGIMASCGICVPAILNRARTGPCPMEEAVDDIKDPARALDLLQQFIKS